MITPTITGLLNCLNLCELAYVAARDERLLPAGAQPIYGETLADRAFDAEKLLGFALPDGTIVFRGSMNAADWVDDFLGLPIPSRGIHAGFQTVYHAIRPSLILALSKLPGGIYPVTVTGHSLGGALAQLAADELGCQAVTFESPRVGPANWTKAEGWLRIANRHDIVPHFPARTQFGHVGGAILFDGGGAFDPARAHSLATCMAALSGWQTVPQTEEID